MTIIQEEKNKLRQQMLIKRAEFASWQKEKLDQNIRDKIEDIVNRKQIQNIAAYFPMGSEIDILPLLIELKNKGIKIYLPKILPKRKMEFRLFESLEKMESGVFGTSHPSSQRVFDGQFDLIITPGLAFDFKKNRLGYGGGYYDRFLINQNQALKIGVCYLFQLKQAIPINENDMLVDKIIHPDKT